MPLTSRLEGVNFGSSAKTRKLCIIGSPGWHDQWCKPSMPVCATCQIFFYKRKSRLVATLWPSPDHPFWRGCSCSFCSWQEFNHAQWKTILMGLWTWMTCRERSVLAMILTYLGPEWCVLRTLRTDVGDQSSLWTILSRYWWGFVGPLHCLCLCTCSVSSRTYFRNAAVKMVHLAPGFKMNWWWLFPWMRGF